MNPPSKPTALATPPVPPTFTMPLSVSEDDIDMLDHASNIAYIRWVQDVALAHSAAVGLGMEGYSQLGAIFVIRRHEIDYLRPVLRGDTLELRTWIVSAAAAKCLRATEIVRGSVVVARALTTWGYVEITSGRPIRIPDSVRVAFSQPTMRELAALRGDTPTSA